VFYHFKYYALKNKSSKSPVFETLILEKERKQLINYFGQCLKAIEKKKKNPEKEKHTAENQSTD